LQDLLPLAALPVKAAIQEMSVGHAMANNLQNKRKMFEGVGDTNLMQVCAGGMRAVEGHRMNHMHSQIEKLR
jgi:hypothetical protein